MLRACLPLWIVLAITASGIASDLTYEADVRPILKEHCFQCHGEQDKFEGSLDLRLRRFVVRGGDSGPAIALGNAKESLLIQRVSDGEMPPDADKRLSREEVEILRRWVDGGAPTTRDEPNSLDAETYFTDEEKNWWAFRPVQKPPLPTVGFKVATPIDAFILAKLAGPRGSDLHLDRAFDLSPPASRVTLIRRVHLDLLGTPPSPTQVRQFVNDAAWNRLVDRVLASPQYGERWGRHWLDVAGYADSEGYTDEDRERKHAWRYRDYVIRAFNEDKSYAEFVVEQLAGDELVGWPQTGLRAEIIDRLTATGFLRTAPDGTGSSGIDQGLGRNQVIADTLQIVGAALLGMTIQCAQCHDHRYDPIPQRDYYQLRAVFEPALDWKDWRTPADRLVSLYGEDDEQRRAEIEAQAQIVDRKRKEKVDFYIERTLEHELLMVARRLQEPLRAAFHTKPGDRTEEQKRILESHANVANIREGSLYLYDRRREARATDLDKRRQEKLASYLARVKNQTLAMLNGAERSDLVAATSSEPEKRTRSQQQLVNEHPGIEVTAPTLGEFDPEAAADVARYAVAAAEIRKFRIRNELQEYSDQAQEIRDTIPTEHFLRILDEESNKSPATFVFHRGDHQQPQQEVEPRGLSVLAAPRVATVSELQTTGRRLQFARYLTTGRHPLVARVLVNRIWAHHFGRGLVSTTGDFGYLGERPTHPELLDWLAAEFVESGWSVKRLHRLILSSRVYGQSAVGPRELVNADPENRWLGRWPLRRLESETMRDVILHTAGKLNTTMYGEPVPVMEDEVGQVVLGKENLDGERKPTDPIPLRGEEFRRSVYIQVRRTRPLGVLEGFDLPELNPNCTERASSNVAPQSLMLMNSNFMVAMSEAMADRLIASRPGDPIEQLSWGWELAFGRWPSESELLKAKEFLRQQTKTLSQAEPQDIVSQGAEDADAHRAALATFCQALLGSNRFLYIE